MVGKWVPAMAGKVKGRYVWCCLVRTMYLSACDVACLAWVRYNKLMFTVPFYLLISAFLFILFTYIDKRFVEQIAFHELMCIKKLLTHYPYLLGMQKLQQKYELEWNVWLQCMLYTHAHSIQTFW